jgi:CSLREA domain-containing protein
VLDSLGPNGGSTGTFALYSSSPALDAGDNTICDDNPGPNNIDQRGVTRPQNGTCDIGSYESNAQPGPTFVVNTDEDSVDGFCDEYLANITDCTLREAITYSNDISGTNTITFDNILGTATIILVDQSLPEITDPNGTTIDGGGDITISGNDLYWIVHTSAPLNLNNITLTKGTCLCTSDPIFFYGGGIYNTSTLIVDNSTFLDNYGSTGGGAIYNEASGTVTVTNSSFADNSSDDDGGAIFNDGILTVSNSVFSGNIANGGEGSGIYNSGSVTVLHSTFFNNINAITNSAGTVTIANSTFSGNSALSGGAINNQAEMTIANSTFSNNSAQDNLIKWGGDIAQSGDSAELNLYNNILANSTQGGNCVIFAGTITGNNNLIEEATTACGFTNGVNGNIIGSDPDLDDLTGSPAYFPLNIGSPAIDAGDDDICEAAPVNNESQNGVTRPQGSHCDVGSYELEDPDDITVTIGGNLMGGYPMASPDSVVKSYAADSGPVEIESHYSTNIIGSIINRYSPNGGTTWSAYNETIGLPANQLTTSYTFPWYNNIELNSQLLFGNVGNATTDVTVTIAGVVQNGGTPYTLAPDQGLRVSYPLNDGPVKVESNGQNIVASLRVAYVDGSTIKFYSEMMGLPSSQLSTNYTFPWYNNQELNSQLRFGNVGNANTTVTVKVGGVTKGTYVLAPSQSVRVSYPNLNNGPVVVSSSGGVPIIASMRYNYFNGAAWTSFAEMMGLPTASLSTKYVFPIYNNVNYNMQLRFGNVGNASTTVTVKVAGVTKGTYNLAPNQSVRVFYTGLNSGPVIIESSGGVKIIASKRFNYFNGTAWTSFTELMGLPFEKLSTTYFFPWYNNVDINTQIVFGQP